MTAFSNIYSLFISRVEMFRTRGEATTRAAFYARKNESWVGSSWEEFSEEVHDFATTLLVNGLPQGGAVTILMGNVPQWPIADIATIAAGGVCVGLYPTSSAEQCAYIINHSDAEFVVVDTEQQLEKVLRVRDRIGRVKLIILMDEGAKGERDGVISYREFVALGRANREVFHAYLQDRATNAKPDETAIMVYTSGTTGLPKGACLSHRYIINSVESLRATIPIYEDEVSFSYLPFCHVAERISGLYNRLYAGAAPYFVDDLSRLSEYMLEVRPTVFASLPRFFEKIHARVVSDLASLNAGDRDRFEAALDLGRRIVRLQQSGADVREELQNEYDESARPELARLRDYFGGRVRLLTSGGAPLPNEIAEFFAACGLPILQAYGLTENVCVAFNRADNYRLGTVGPPMPGCEVRIAADGEIMVRSEMMFSGYYKSPDQTAEVMRDGWLMTGDLGEFDDAGFLQITGRKKELIVTSTGKKIAPALLENLLKENHLVSHAMVYGEGRSYLVALITLNPTEVEEFARMRGLEFETYADLASSDAMRTVIGETIDRVNARVSSSESIRRYAILERDLQIELDEVTPTGKMRRKEVTERFRHVIEAMYNAAAG